MDTSRSQYAACKFVNYRTLELETEDGTEFLYNGVVVTEDTLLVIDYCAKNLKLYSRHDGKLLSTSHIQASRPRGVCLISKTEVAICLKNSSIVIMSFKTTDDIKLVKTLDVKTGFDVCDSVEKLNSDKVIVSGWNNEMILYWCIVNLTDGRVDSAHKICEGYGVDVAIKDNAVYISCQTTESTVNGVYAYDIFNPQTHKFLYQHQELEKPGSIMLDRRNSIFVCDLYSNRIHQLSDSGQLVTIHIVSSEPYGIFYDDQHGVLYTTSNDSNVITVYTMEYLHQPGVPIEILNMDDKSIKLFEEALKDGRETVYSMRIMVVGHIGVGKTTLVKRLLGDEVNISDRCSTEGIDVHVNCCDVSLLTCEWKRLREDSEQSYRLQRLARVLIEQQSIKDKTTPEEQVIIPHQGETTHKKHKMVDIAAEGEKSDVLYSRFPQQDTGQDFSSPASQQEESHPALTQRELIKSETSTTAMLKLLKENANNLNQDTGKTFPLTVWDFAGQYAFYTTHQTFLTRRAIYLLVSDVSQQLTDLVADECYFDSDGIMKCKVHELIEVWLNSIHLCAPFLEAGMPPVILVGTHVDKCLQRCVADNRFNNASEIVVNTDEYSTPPGVEDNSQEILIALYGFIGNDPEDLSFSEGDKLICIKKSDSGWWLARNSLGEVGQVPSNFMQVKTGLADFAQEVVVCTDELSIEAVDIDNNQELLIALYSFIGIDPEDLSFSEGDNLMFVAKSSHGWLQARNSRGEVGLVPSNYVSLEGISYKMCERYFREIRSYLRDKPTRFHLVDEDFAINNTVVDPRLSALKRKIVEVASQQPYWGEVRPARWIPLEQELMTLKSAGIKVIPWSLLEDLNKALAVPLATEELDLFLRFQHDFGTVLYFSVEILKTKIVLDPKWMIDALKSLITAEMFVLRSIPAVSEKWFDFKEKGKLSQELVDALWTKKKYPDLHDNKEHILLLMEQLNIIAKLRVYSEETSQIKEENCFLAPCMLSQKTPREVICPVPHPQMESSSVICYVFTGKYLPSPIFHRLLAACVAHWPIATKKNENTLDNLIYCGCCVFQLDNFHKLTIHSRDYIIFMRVTKMGIKHKTPSSELCIEVRQFVTATLIKIIGYLGQNLKFEYFIQCPEYSGDSINSLIPVSQLRENAEVCCELHNNMIESYRLLQFWFEDMGSQGEKGGQTENKDIRDQNVFQVLDMRTTAVNIPSKLYQSKGVPCLDPKLLCQILDKSQQAGYSSQSTLEVNCLSLGLEFLGETPANGNCFFEAISNQLQRLNCGIQKSPQQLRQEVVAFMRTNRVLHAPEGNIHLDGFIYDETYDEYCTRMARDGEWADHVVVVAMARKLQMDIFIVMSTPSSGPDENIVWVVGQSGFQGNPILIGHISESHYLSLQPIAPMADVIQAQSSVSTPSIAFDLIQTSTFNSSPSSTTRSASSPTSSSKTSDILHISTSSSATADIIQASIRGFTTADIMQIPTSASTITDAKPVSTSVFTLSASSGLMQASAPGSTPSLSSSTGDVIITATYSATSTDVKQALASRSITADLIQSPTSGSTTADTLQEPTSVSTTTVVKPTLISASTRSTFDLMQATSASTPSTTDQMQATSASTPSITYGFIPSPTSTYTTTDVMQTATAGSTITVVMQAPLPCLTTADIMQASTSGTTTTVIMQAPATPSTTAGSMSSPTSILNAASLLQSQTLCSPPSAAAAPMQAATSSSPPSTTGGHMPASASNFTAAGLLQSQMANTLQYTTGDPVEAPTSSSTASDVSQPPSVDDTDRFMHIACLLVNVGSRVLRRLFIHHTVTPGCTLDQYLANNRIDIDDLRKKRILNTSQMDILFPQGGSTNLGDYDITLLSALFTNIVLTISPQELNMIQVLRDKRNEIFAHARSVTVNSNDYQTFWNDISTTLEALSKQCGDPDFVNDIFREIQGIQLSTLHGTSFHDTLQTCPRRIETLERLVQTLILSQTQESKKESDNND